MRAREATIRQGELVFSEGEPSDHVALVLEGEVEVFRTLGGREVVLGVVPAGEFVGEMGVLEGRRRAASVRARTAVRVRFLGREDFVARVAHDPDLARELLLRMSERLRRVDDRLATLVAGTTPQRPPGPELPEIRLFAAARELERWLPASGRRIERLPFTVGRRPSPGERGPDAAVDLAIADGRPYRLSRRHFAILAEPDGPYLVDVGSRLGTIVDDVPLGEVFARTRYRLTPGEHTIVAGGVHSPFRFRVLVAGPGEAAVAGGPEGAREQGR